jgi:hypothetical protein
MDTELNGPAQAFKFSAGLKQQFPVEAAHLNLSGFAKEDLTSKREDFYPIVIAIESMLPSSPGQDKVKRSIQYTYGMFEAEENAYKYKYLK